MRLMIAAVLLLGLSACASAPEPKAKPPKASEPAARSEQQAPPTGVWAFGGHREYKAPGLGFSLRYNTTNGWGDLYIYDAQRTWEEGTSDPQFGAHFDGVLSEIRQAEQAGSYSDVKLGKPANWSIDGQPFVWTTVSFKSDNVPFDSWVLLTAHRGQLIKYRVSFRHPQPEDARKRVEALVHETFSSAGAKPGAPQPLSKT